MNSEEAGVRERQPYRAVRFREDSGVYVMLLFRYFILKTNKALTIR